MHTGLHLLMCFMCRRQRRTTTSHRAEHRHPRIALPRLNHPQLHQDRDRRSRQTGDQIEPSAHRSIHE